MSRIMNLEGTYERICDASPQIVTLMNLLLLLNFQVILLDLGLATYMDACNH